MARHTEEHTSAPWAVDPETGHIRARFVSDVNGYPGAEIAQLVWSEAHDRRAANAAHIVHCVNTHEELVTVIRDLVKAREIGMGKSAVDLRYELAKDALAKEEAYQKGA